MPNDYFDAYHNQWQVSSLCSVWNTNDSFVCFFSVQSAISQY